MHKFMIAATFALLVTGLAAAVDSNPPMLISQPIIGGCGPVETGKAKPARVADPVCKPEPVCAPTPPPPVAACKPEPICGPAPAPAPVAACRPEPVCAPKPAVCSTTTALRDRPPAEEFRLVPVKKKVYEEELYMSEETHTQIIDEVRTRPAKINSPRLARVVDQDGARFAVHKKEPYDVTYVKKVKQTYTVPVTKSRKVAKEVEEIKIVPNKRVFSW